MRFRHAAAILLVLLLPVVAGAAEPVKVVTEEFPPLQYSEGGKLAGPSAEIVREVFARAGLEADISVLPWARAYKMATSEPDVVIFSIGRTSGRESLFRWIGPIADKGPAYFYTARTDIEAHGIEDVKRYVVGSSLNDVILEYLKRNGFEEGKNLVELRSYEAGYRMLKARRIDFFPISENMMHYLLRHDPDGPPAIRAVLPVDSENMKIDDFEGDYLATSLTTSDQLYGKLKTALESMKADGTFRAILDKYRYVPPG